MELITGTVHPFPWLVSGSLIDLNPPPQITYPGVRYLPDAQQGQGGTLFGGVHYLGVSLSPSPSPSVAFSFVVGMQPCPHEWH